MTKQVRTKSTRKHSSKSSNFPWPKIVTLAIIGIAFIAVIAATIYSIFHTPENAIHSLVESLSKDYYENYIYSDVASNPNSTPENALSPYVKNGLTPVKLRQILLYGEERNVKITATVEEYCNTEQTTVRFYPHTPYGKTDYTTKINYTCNF